MFKKTGNAIILAVVLVAAASAQDLTKSDLIGKWGTGGMSTIGERNTVTGATTPSNGNTQWYEFKPDGRFAFVGYMQSTMYGCKTDLFNDKQGKYAIDGNKLTLTLSKNFWRNTYSCSPASNKERNYTLGEEVYEIRTKTDEYGKHFICLANAKGEACYRRDS